MIYLYRTNIRCYSFWYDHLQPVNIHPPSPHFSSNFSSSATMTYNSLHIWLDSSKLQPHHTESLFPLSRQHALHGHPLSAPQSHSSPQKIDQMMVIHIPILSRFKILHSISSKHFAVATKHPSAQLEVSDHQRRQWGQNRPCSVRERFWGKPPTKIYPNFFVFYLRIDSSLVGSNLRTAWNLSLTWQFGWTGSLTKSSLVRLCLRIRSSLEDDFRSP